MNWRLPGAELPNMLSRHCLITSLFLILALAWTGRPLTGAAPGKGKLPASAPSFAADIRPLLEAKCLRCHGEKVRRADLDLRSVAAILKGGESGPAGIPGKPDESPLYEKVHSGA